jgi:hypothetical protein
MSVRGSHDVKDLASRLPRTYTDASVSLVYRVRMYVYTLDLYALHFSHSGRLNDDSSMKTRVLLNALCYARHQIYISPRPLFLGTRSLLRVPATPRFDTLGTIAYLTHRSRDWYIARPWSGYKRKSPREREASAIEILVVIRYFHLQGEKWATWMIRSQMRTDRSCGEE